MRIVANCGQEARELTEVCANRLNMVEMFGERGILIHNPYSVSSRRSFYELVNNECMSVYLIYIYI